MKDIIEVADSNDMMDNIMYPYRKGMLSFEIETAKREIARMASAVKVLAPHVQIMLNEII